MALSSHQNQRLNGALDNLTEKVREEIRIEQPELTDEKFLNLAGAVHDPGDESVADLLSDVNIALLERHFKDLRAIESARKRLAAGEIEQCADCGNDIGIERLLVNPTASRCIPCQERHERLNRSARPPSL